MDGWLGFNGILSTQVAARWLVGILNIILEVSMTRPTNDIRQYMTSSRHGYSPVTII